jgi:hypothetical protein
MPKIDEDIGRIGEDAIKAADKDNMGAIEDLTKERLGLGDWFPSVPTAACTNPSVNNPVTGASVQVDICYYVNVFARFISGVICFFALIGAVQQVQSAMKA